MTIIFHKRRILVAGFALAGIGLLYAYSTTNQTSPARPPDRYAALAAAADARQEVVGERGRFSKVFQVAADLRMMRFSAQPVHYQDETGQWQEIDTTVLPSQREGYDLEVTHNEFQVYFRQNATGDSLVRYEARGAAIEFGVASRQPWGRLQPTQAQAEGNRVVYPSLFSGVDLRYELSPRQLLEEFIVQQPERAQQMAEIDKWFRAEGVSWQVEPDGSMAFVRKTDGDKLWHIPRPVMYELRHPGNQSDGLHFEIDDQGGLVHVRKVVDAAGQAWLSDPSRQFPVVLDDTLDLDETKLTSLGDGYVRKDTGSAADCTFQATSYTRVSNQATNYVGCRAPTGGNLSVYDGFFEWNVADAVGKTNIQAVGVYLRGITLYNAGVDFVKLTAAPTALPTPQDLFNAIQSPVQTYNTAGSLATGNNYIPLGYIPPANSPACQSCRQAVDDFTAAVGGSNLFYFGVKISNLTSSSTYGSYAAKESTTPDSQPDLVVFYQGSFGTEVIPERPLRNVFWDGTRYWLFYTDSTGVRYAYSSDGSSWTQVDVLDDIAESRHHAVWYNPSDNTVYVAYHVRRSGDPELVGDMVVKVGTISGTTINWDTRIGNRVALNAIETASEGYDFPSITKDNENYCWVLSRWAIATPTADCQVGGSNGYCYAAVLTRSNNTTCTDWPDSSSYITITNVIHHTSSPADVLKPGGYVVPLVANNQVYTVYKDYALTTEPIYGKACRHDGTSITCSSSQTIDDNAATGVYIWGMSPVAIGDVVHLAYIDDDLSLQYRNRSTSGVWSAATALESGVNIDGPALTLDPSTNNDLYLFYKSAMPLPTPNPTPAPHGGSGCVYYRRATGSGTAYTWGSRTQAACNIWSPADSFNGDYPLFSNYSSKGNTSTTRKILGMWVESIFGVDDYAITP